MAVQIDRGFDLDGSRYPYDSALCRLGWAQLDSTSGAPWFGQWACPVRLRLFSYCEGDTTLIKCDTIAEFAAEVRKVAEWHSKHDSWLGIDYGLRPSARDHWVAAGLSDLFHSQEN
jgi:hypothetical protein